MLVVIFAIAGQPVRAQTTAYAAGQGAVNSIEVGVEVRASVTGRCGFATSGAPSGTIDQADFDVNGFSRDFAIQLNCTGASRIAVSSLNGGMASQAAGGSGYQTKAPYRVALSIWWPTTVRMLRPPAMRPRCRRVARAALQEPRPQPRGSALPEPRRR